MACSRHLFPTLKAACPFLLPTQVANLALLVGAIVQQRTLNLTRLARAFPIPPERRVPQPKHELLHRLKRLARFLSNEGVDPLAVQVACLPTLWAHLGSPRWVGLLLDWTSFDVALPGLVGGGVRKYQVLTIAVPRCGRAVPLLSVTSERDQRPARGSQNRWASGRWSSATAASAGRG